jgi:hypothetical protein
MLDESTGALALVIDKWDRKFEAETGNTLVEYVGRGLGIPDDDAEPPAVGSYVGTYKFEPNGKWKGSGTGTETFKDGSTTNYTWEEVSTLKEGTYKYTGGTGKYAGVSGSGTYTLYEGYDTYRPGTLQGCKYNDQIVMPAQV